MFTIKNLNLRKLVSCIPTVSTHRETDWLAKFVDWDKEFYLSIEKSSINGAYNFLS